MTDHGGVTSDAGNPGAESSGSLNVGPLPEVPLEKLGTQADEWLPTHSRPDASFGQKLDSLSFAQTAVSWREVFCLSCIIALADITLFRGTGYAGIAAFLVLAPLLFLLGSPTPTVSRALAGVGGMLVLMAARLSWQGSILGVCTGFLLVIAFAMALARRTPFVVELLKFAVYAILISSEPALCYLQWVRQRLRKFPNIFSLQWILPLFAVLIFGGIFIAANPDLVTSVNRLINQILNSMTRWLELYSVSPWEVLFCLGVGWYAIGLLRPFEPQKSAAKCGTPATNREEPLTVAQILQPTPFVPYRNTLAAVSVLFAAYLVFEFLTLWFRKFPPGFHYSGYAHQGAAWLTVALALATVILSVMLRGPLLQDRRLPRLRFWAWIWSVENVVLALAVYNRLWIYVGFNGMTRMRTIAFLGITSVLVGFFLVLWKIAHNRDFQWLIRRQILTVALAGYVYLIMPVDWLVYTYNVHRILAGDPGPVVQITEHYVSPEGILTLPPLLDSEDPLIREGIRSLLENSALQEAFSPNREPGWTRYQFVHQQLSKILESPTDIQVDEESGNLREGRWQVLKQYAYQWY